MRYALLLLGLFMACRERTLPAPMLAVGAARVCDPSDPLLISVDAVGRYELNGRAQSGEQLSRTLAVLLQLRPSKVVMVQVDTAYRLNLTWLIREIESYGATAYEADSLCLRSTPWFRGAGARVHKPGG